MKIILVTGGCGYIGSHFIASLNPNNFKIIIIDNLSNSSLDIIDKLRQITNIDISFHNENLLNFKKINSILSNYKIDLVVHFAGLKSVSESIKYPELYYNNNVKGSINLFKAMHNNFINKIIFSSSASVYGNQEKQPINENVTLNPLNPYAETKVAIEEILKKITKKNKNFSSISLRYFNPIGAHNSGLLAESPKRPTNIMPLIVNVAKGIVTKLQVFGNDYPTSDGTGLRDYIHILDLVDAHIASIDFIKKNKGSFVFNIGTGKPYSVLELIKTFEKVNKLKINFKFSLRRDGDIACCYANPLLANKKLKWKASRTLEQMCFDALNY